MKTLRLKNNNVVFVNFSVKSPIKVVPKLLISHFQPILAAIFVTIATVKVYLLPGFYTWAIVLIILLEEFVKSNFIGRITL